MSPSTRKICASFGLAQSRGILCDYVKHRLNVRWRAGDDAQDFTRGRLLLQRLLQFLKQPNVLDGDHGLVGKGFEQRDLFFRKGTNLGPTNLNCAYCDSFT